MHFDKQAVYWERLGRFASARSVLSKREKGRKKMTAPVKLVVAILILIVATDVVREHPEIILLVGALALVFYKGKSIGRKEESDKHKEKSSWKRY